MIIHHVRQGSEEWEELRRGKLTVSEFGRILTPAKLQLSAGARGYAVQKVAERFGISSPPMTPTFFMDRGSELEPHAVSEFEQVIAPVQRVGFIQLAEGVDVGGSPDGLVGDDGCLEVKCPKAETLIEWILDGELPNEHRMQCQGVLWLTGRNVCHFWGWHPQLIPFHLEIERDEAVMKALDDAVPRVLEMMAEIVELVSIRPSVLTATQYETEDLTQ